MDKSKHGKAGNSVQGSQTVSFYQSVQFVKDVESESWGLKRVCDSEHFCWVDTAGLHPCHGDHMDTGHAPPIGQAGDVSCDG